MKQDAFVVQHRMQAQSEKALRRAVTERVNEILAQQAWSDFDVYK